MRFRPGTSEADREALRHRHGTTLQQALPLAGLQLLDIGRETSVGSAVARLEEEPDVLYAEPNYVVEMSRRPDDQRFWEQWPLENHGTSLSGVVGRRDADVDAPEAWELTTGSPDVTVAVVDSGVDYEHPDLRPNLSANPAEAGSGREANGVDDDRNGFVDDWRGWDFRDDDNDPRETPNHGTAVASIAAARGGNGYGMAGVAWFAKVMPLRINTENATSAMVAAAFAYAGQQHVQVVNGSFISPGFSQAVLDAIEAAPRTLFVAAAGNWSDDNDAQPLYPCAYPAENLICVAASDERDQLAGFSNYGRASVDLAAPGERVFHLAPGGDFGNSSGTSVSTPHVAGAAALVMSHMPTATVGEVRDRLLDNVDRTSELEDKVASGGRLNVARALGLSPAPPASLSEQDRRRHPTRVRSARPSWPSYCSWPSSSSVADGSLPPPPIMQVGSPRMVDILRRGLRVRLCWPTDSTIVEDLVVDRMTASRLAMPRRLGGLVARRVLWLEGGRTVETPIRLAPHVRRTLGSVRSPRLTLRVTATDETGHRTMITRPVRLSRARATRPGPPPRATLGRRERRPVPARSG